MPHQIVIADEKSLLRLAKAGRLALLEGFKRLHIPDLVLLELEAMEDPDALEAARWGRKVVDQGGVNYYETSMGLALKLARVSTPGYVPLSGVVTHVIEWLLNVSSLIPVPALILTEEDVVYRAILRHDADQAAGVVDAEGFLSFCVLAGVVDEEVSAKCSESARAKGERALSYLTERP
ncbi:hypothetical protein HNP46_000019 [Pseudomonas nitritireducens]|uniref:Uncharacterized protein n=1 Tax=Pseudomonas nitroreducens TaxID=46680 RepID=A0A7W7KFD1_PSENT|nr:hypothetical protein [Pseudomonas nitritireducens]MBB4861208.1 hypothetical protein [Pseudomonas nitritireducens]